jgi:purine-binding chemotaxis protein CheW
MSVLHVVFKVGKSEYALPASDVLQMESYAGATAVPGSKPWVSGIIQVRGRIVPVVDLRRRFGLPPQELTADSRVVVATHGERAVALVADAAREVVKLEVEKWQAAPQIVAQEAQGLVKAVAQVGQRLVMLLDLTQLMEKE